MIDASQYSSPVGLIAGNGSFPIEFVENAKKAGLAVVVVAIKDEADPKLREMADHFEVLKVGQVGKAIKIFKKNGVKQVAFAGGVRRVRLFGGFKLDLTAITILARCHSIRDDALLKEIAKEFEKNGMTIFSATSFLNDSTDQIGLITQRALTDEEKADAKIGWEVAKGLGSLDVGQTVVVHQRLVVAVEAIEGTDATILRAGELAGTDKRRKVGQGCVIVKLSKPQQDLRLDLPTIGVNTIVSAEKAGVSAIVLESGKSIILDRQAVVDRANQLKIAIFLAASTDDI